jgi:hypothetical protein
MDFEIWFKKKKLIFRLYFCIDKYHLPKNSVEAFR